MADIADDFPANTQTTGVLTIGGSVKGHFETGQDRDWFKVHLEAGVTYHFTMGGAATGQGTLVGSTEERQAGLAIRTAYNQVGTSVSKGAADILPLLQFTPETSGDYFLNAYSRTSATGTYTITASVAAKDDYGSYVAVTTPVTSNIIHGNIEVGSDQDWFRVPLEAGRLYSATLTDADGSTGGQLGVSLSDSYNNYIDLFQADNGNNGYYQLSGAVDDSGNYDVVVYSSGAPGAYTLTLGEARDDYYSSYDTTGRLTVGGSVRGRIDLPNDKDWFAINLEQGRTYVLSATGDNQATLSVSAMDYLNTIDADGTFFARTTGTYYVQVSNPYAGSYRLQAVAADAANQDAADPASISAGAALTARYNFDGDTDVYKLHVEAGNVYHWRFSNALQGSTTTKFATGANYASVAVTNLGHFTDTDGSYVLAFQATQSGDVYAQSTHYGTAGSYQTQVVNKGALDLIGPSIIQDSVVIGSRSVTLRFNEPVTIGALGNGTSFSVQPTGEFYNSQSSIQAALSGNGTELTIKLANPLMPGKTYDIYAPSDAITDQAGNRMTSAFVYNVRYAASTGPDNSNGYYVGTGDYSLINGGGGLDTVVYPGHPSAFSVTRTGDAVRLNWGFDGAGNQLSGIERVMFTSTNLALALDIHGVAGQAYRLYQAAFNRKPDPEGLGYWITAMDRGVSLHDATQSFIASQEFQSQYGAAPSDAEFVNHLYNNVLHRAGEAAGVQYWMDVLKSGQARADVLASFSEGTENTANVASAISGGISYFPYF